MAQVFQQIIYDPKQCRIEIGEFGALLAANEELAEARDILPFFKKRQQLSAFIGSYPPVVGPVTDICFEYQIHNDYAADLVIGMKTRRRFCAIEFEDGRGDSIFKPSPNKMTRVWSPRFEHGFSQIVDWYFLLSDQKQTERFKRDFGDGHIQFSPMLVIGRDSGITDPYDRYRLDWRSDKVIVDTNRVSCVTFDKLHRHMDHQLKLTTGL